MLNWKKRQQKQCERITEVRDVRKILGKNPKEIQKQRETEHNTEIGKLQSE